MSETFGKSDICMRAFFLAATCVASVAAAEEGLLLKQGVKVLENGELLDLRDSAYSILASAMNTAEGVTREIEAELQADIGAEDYVTKPFSLPVLKARVEALMHRYKGRSTDQLLTAPGIVCDPQARTVVVDGKNVDMPPKVFSLLVFLMENKGRILTREQILDRVWGSESIIFDRAVDGTIKKLRRLLGSRSGYIHDHFVIITPSHSCTGTAWYKLVKIRYFPNRGSAVRQKIRRPAGSFSSDSWSARSAAHVPAARNPAESYNRSSRSA